MLRRNDDAVIGLAQGGILRPHGRQFALHLVFEFADHASRDDMKAWLGSVCFNLTTDHLQKESAEKYRVKGVANNHFLTIGLSENGWRKIAGTDDGFPEPSPSLNTGSVKLKRFGDVAKYADYAEDGKRLEEDISGQYDGIIIIANDFSHLIEEKAKEIIAYSKNGGNVLARHYSQRGAQRSVFGENGERRNVGPLGYVDGLSGPSDNKKIAESAFFCDLLLEEEGDTIVKGYGSKLAFIKLEVKLDEYYNYLEIISGAIKEKSQGRNPSEEIGLAKAIIMGRFQNGESLETWDGLNAGKVGNVFSYLSDGDDRCPYFSHVRAVNPRLNADENPIVRRSMPYAEFWNGKFEEGLLFMSYQASLKEQFLPVVQRIQENTDVLLYSKGFNGKNRVTHNKNGTIEHTGDFTFREEEPKITKFHFEHHFYFPSPGRLKLLLKPDQPL